MTNEWIPHDGTGVNPVREGETLTAYKLRSGVEYRRPAEASSYDWRDEYRNHSITHYRVTPPRAAAPIAEPATMSADEVLIRAREAAIEAYQWQGKDMWGGFRAGKNDSDDRIQAILVYERDRAKPLADVAPHTAERDAALDAALATDAAVAAAYTDAARAAYEAALAAQPKEPTDD